MGNENLTLGINIDAETQSLQGKLEGLVGSLGKFTVVALAAGGMYSLAEAVGKAVDAFSLMEDKMALIKTLGVFVRLRASFSGIFLSLCQSWIGTLLQFIKHIC